MKALMRFYIIIFCISVILITACANTQEYAGKVNKRLIKSTDYKLLIKNEYESFFLERNASPSPQEQKIIEQRAWDRMVEGLILKDIYEKYQISVSHSEIIDTLKFNIPDMIKKSPQFLNPQGSFDYSKYETSLLSNKPVDLTWLKNFYYTSYIPMAKLKKLVITKREIKESDIKNYYYIRNNEINGYAIFFNHEDYIDKAEISNTEIENYYRAHISDFEITASCHLKWVKFPIIADKADSLSAKNKADSLFMLVQKGSDFSLIASKHSDGEFGPQKGYAGFFEMNQFPDDIKKQISESEEDTVLRPIYMNGRFYIFKIVEKTVNMVKLMAIQTDIKATEQTHNRIKDRIKQFRELCNSIGFNLAVKEYQYEVFEKDSLSVNDTFLPEFGPSDNVVRKALRTPAGVVFDPIKNDKLNTYIVFYVQQNTPRSFKKIQEVSGNIIQNLKKDKAKDIALNDAQVFLKQYSGQLLSQANKENKHIEYLKSYNFNSKIQNMNTPAFNESILSQNRKNQILVQEEQTAIIAIVDEVKNVNMNGLVFEREEIKKILQKLNQDQYFEEFMNNEKAKASIKDYRLKIKK